MAQILECQPDSYLAREASTRGSPKYRGLRILHGRQWLSRRCLPGSLQRWRWSWDPALVAGDAIGNLAGFSVLRATALVGRYSNVTLSYPILTQRQQQDGFTTGTTRFLSTASATCHKDKYHCPTNSTNLQHSSSQQTSVIMMIEGLRERFLNARDLLAGVDFSFLFTPIKEERKPKPVAPCILSAKRRKKKGQWGSRGSSQHSVPDLVDRSLKESSKSMPGASKFIGVLDIPIWYGYLLKRETPGAGHSIPGRPAHLDPTKIPPRDRDIHLVDLKFCPDPKPFPTSGNTTLNLSKLLE
eukprot:1136853-Pelagomonas_calceolata.AAC.2